MSESESDRKGLRRRRALMVVNRRASRARDALPGLRKLLESVGIEADLHVPDEPAAISRLIREAGPDASCIIVGGGDGTLHHAASALLHSGRPLGVLPIGTANDLARNLGLPLEPESALRVIAAGHARWIDLGRVEDTLFFNVASFGLTGRTTRRLDEQRKRRWGVLSYPLTALSALRDLRSFDVEIQSVEGQRESLRAIQVEVANGRMHGGGLTVDRQSRLDDGLLTLYVIEAQSLWRLALRLPLLALGRGRSSPGARVRDERELWIKTSRPLEVSADGEIVTRTPAVFRIEPHALRVFVPKAEKE